MDVDGLQVKIGADTSGLEDAAGKVKAASDKMGDSLTGASEKGSSGFGSLGSAATDLVTDLLPVVGIAEAIEKAFEIGVEAFKKYGEHVKAVTDLTAILQANGVKNVDDVVKHTEKLAEQMQDVTNTSRDATLALAAHAAALGVQPARLDETTKAAIGLAKVLGVDVNTALTDVVKAQGGNFQMLQRTMPMINEAKTAQEKYAMVIERAQVGLKALNAETNEGMGPTQKLSLAWDDIQVTMGKSIAEGLNPLIEKFRQFLPTIMDVGKVILDLVTLAFEPLIIMIKMTMGGINALVDVFHGRFKQGIGEFADAVKSSAKGLINSYIDIGKDSYKAFKQGQADAAKSDSSDVGDALNIKGGGVKTAKEPKVPTFQFETFTQVVKKAQAEMQNLGGTRLDMLTEEIKGAEGSLKTLADNGVTSGKAVDDLKYGIGMIKQEMSTAHLEIPIQSLQTKIDTFNGGPLLELHKKFSEIAETVKVFGKNAGIDMMREQLNACGATLDKMIKDGANLSDPVTFDKVKAEYDSLNEKIREADLATQKLQKSNEMMGKMASQAAEVAGAAIGGMISGQKVNFGSAIFKMLGDIVKQLGASVLATGALMGTTPLTATLSIGQIAEGTGLIALGSAMGAIKMASGGIVHGSTIANVGEYAGANHNPEVVAPLSKLQGMLGNSGGGGHLTTRISGSDILIALNKEMSNQGLSSGGNGIQPYQMGS